MFYNKRFGKLDGTAFTYAPRDLGYGGRTYVCCDNAELYYAAGYRDVVEDVEERLGATAVFDHATQEDDRYEHHEETDPETGEKHEWDELVYRGKIIRHYRYEPIVAPPPRVRRWSQRNIMLTLKAADKWAQAKEMMLQMDAWDEFVISQYIEENSPSFIAAREAAYQAFGKEAVDTLIDQIPEE